MVCPECRDRLQETDSYVRAMRTATAKLKKEDEATAGESKWRLADVLAAMRPAAVAVGIAAALLCIYWLTGAWRPFSGGSAPVAVVLQLVRGGAALEASAPAGKPLRLEMELAGLSAQTSYGLEIADAGGVVAWKTSVSPSNGKLAAMVPHNLSPGAYWVRLYATTAERELVREYGLGVQ